MATSVEELSYAQARYDSRVKDPFVSLRALSRYEMEYLDESILLATRQLQCLTCDRDEIGGIFRMHWHAPHMSEVTKGQYYQYYLAVLNALKDVRQRGYITLRDDYLLFNLGATSSFLLHKRNKTA